MLGIDGKTQRGNGTNYQEANHIVSAVDEKGFCVGEVRVNNKSNEITAIPELINNLNLKGNIITIDAMGCQRKIAKIIRRKQSDYLLALKGNQSTLHKDVELYFEDFEFLGKCAYHKTLEKARSGIELREYWQTDNIGWLSQKKDWAGLKSIVMTRNTITKNGKTTVETRYFISSLPLNVTEVAYAVRGHWMVESYHWHLDVTFREDANRTADKYAAYNLNIIKKISINTLKVIDVGINKVSLSKKRYIISMDFGRFFESLMAI